MKANFYLVVNSNGTIKAVKNRPGLNWNEVSILMNLTLPDSLFRKPQLQATIEVKEDQTQPITIDAETQNNIKEAIEQAAGVEVRLELVAPE